MSVYARCMLSTAEIQTGIACLQGVREGCLRICSTRNASHLKSSKQPPSLRFHALPAAQPDPRCCPAAKLAALQKTCGMTLYDSRGWGARCQSAGASKVALKPQTQVRVAGNSRASACQGCMKCVNLVITTGRRLHVMCKSFISSLAVSQAIEMLCTCTSQMAVVASKLAVARYLPSGDQLLHLMLR